MSEAMIQSNRLARQLPAHTLMYPAVSTQAAAIHQAANAAAAG